MAELTDLQVKALVDCHNACRKGEWYRANGNGQRVTLSSLYRRGYLERRAWRGREGEADAAHEYRPTYSTGL